MSRKFCGVIMIDNVSPCSRVCLVRLLGACVLVCASISLAAQTPTNTGPVLLTDHTSTRAVALESVTFKREPFPVATDIAWNSDRRTRVMLFAMNLNFLAGEGANAVTADAEDASGRRYPLNVEYIGKVREQEWMYAVVVRLHDEMVDTLGDVLVRINLHGVASNRARLAIGQNGGGPPDDPGAVPVPAPATPPAPTPTPTPHQYLAGQSTTADTVRFLEQSSWGPTTAEVARVQSIGFRAYLNEQFNAPASSYPRMTLMPADNAQGCPTAMTTPPDPNYNQSVCRRLNYSMYPLQTKFFRNAMYEPDQLRQRVAFALHQIFVVSGRDIAYPAWMSEYLQILDRHAFGNFRPLLQDMTLNPAMGEYLNMRGNTRANPNENFAREVLQLFSTGLDELNPDGTPKLNAQGQRLPTYEQEDVTAFARVFTGWNLVPGKTITINGAVLGVPNYHDPMFVSAASENNNHDKGAKTLLNGLVLPANQTSTQDLSGGLDNIFNHPNVGPFIGKQLIQHLVTSNPSPPYVQRVAAVFNNDCSGLYAEGCTGVRGNLRAVVTAILLDPEARGDAKTDPNYGKLREPAQLVNNLLRAFNAKSFDRTQNSDGSLQGETSVLDQDIFRPVTVFSYYQPDYEVPGTKLLGPAFGILTTSTSLRRANFVNTIIYSGITRTTPTPAGCTTACDPGNRPLGTALDLSALQSQASDPQALVNALDALLLHGTMSAAMRASIVQAVSAIPTSDAQHQLKRARTAVYLVATSSSYQVQK